MRRSRIVRGRGGGGNKFETDLLEVGQGRLVANTEPLPVKGPVLRHPEVSCHWQDQGGSGRAAVVRQGDAVEEGGAVALSTSTLQKLLKPWSI